MLCSGVVAEAGVAKYTLIESADGSRCGVKADWQSHERLSGEPSARFHFRRPTDTLPITLQAPCRQLRIPVAAGRQALSCRWPIECKHPAAAVTDHTGMARAGLRSGLSASAITVGALKTRLGDQHATFTIAHGAGRITATTRLSAPCAPFRSVRNGVDNDFYVCLTYHPHLLLNPTICCATRECEESLLGYCRQTERLNTGPLREAVY
jgi:hypothetical protein